MVVTELAAVRAALGAVVAELDVRQLVSGGSAECVALALLMICDFPAAGKLCFMC